MHDAGDVRRVDRTRDARGIAGELRKESYAESRGGITILDATIPAGVAFREAATRREPVHRWDRGRSLEAMTAVAAELLPHLGEDLFRFAAAPKGTEQDAEGGEA
jgi:chromosome partitioning related protein ParA